MASPGAFPSLKIRANKLVPQGSFAEAQAAFLYPERSTVEKLDRLLSEKNVGVVAHFYMDPELQGVLAACVWPHIHVSDSLAMADRAIQMAEAGVTTIVVLGVDFMSENVRAMLDASGHRDVRVYRVAADPIGCSLAEAAEAEAYGAYLQQASKTKNALHVVYINTSLISKAKAQALVPTITCTSSNVVRTVLQAAHQVPEIEIFFGPDTYMGENLEQMFRTLAQLDDESVRSVHPAHTAKSVAAMLPRFHYFKQGNCIVHHMFGHEVVRTAEEKYPNAMVTAHLEVPGEMFSLGLSAQRVGRGVVGSTSNILSFILAKVEDAIANDNASELSFILGTEAGMITPIVKQVQRRLIDDAAEGGAPVDVEIIFPVASEAIAESADKSLPVVPGVASGEGCSVAGGCATCPYMKMNSLRGTFALLESLGVRSGNELLPYEPRVYTEAIRGRTAADLGGEPILSMREFQKTGELSQNLVDDIVGRGRQAG
ncbi:MAG: quinolinate synthase NadA [Polyangiales bacterium]